MDGFNWLLARPSTLLCVGMGYDSLFSSYDDDRLPSIRFGSTLLILIDSLIHEEVEYCRIRVR